MKNQNFKHMSDFFAAWFNQDFDINGSSILEIVSKFKQTSSKRECGALQLEISRFLADYSDNIAVKLQQMFELEVNPLGFSSSAEAFLLEINEVLSQC